jgi:hypothetical protein
VLTVVVGDAVVAVTGIATGVAAAGALAPPAAVAAAGSGAPGATFVTPGSPQATTPKKMAPTPTKHALTIVMINNLSLTLFARTTA